MNVVVEVNGSTSFHVDQVPSLIEDGLATLRAELNTGQTNTENALDALRGTLGTLQGTVQGAVTNATNAIGAAAVSTQTAMGALETRISAAMSSQAGVASNASICSARGQLYNETSTSCYQRGFAEPDWQSPWSQMASRQGTNSYQEFTWCSPASQCRTPPERVNVVMRPSNMPDHAAITFDGMGAGTCDDDAACGDYGGLVFAYDNTRIRVWLPDRNNGRSNGRAIMITDGWGGNRRDISQDQVRVKARVWKTYREGESAFFDTQFRMRAGRGVPRTDAYKEITYDPRANGNSPWPDRVLVEAIATRGPNNGFRFVSKGASVVDNDGGKDYGGVVAAYTQQKVRLWTATSANGFVIFVKDGWGGERNAQWERNANVRVRVWRNTEASAPDFESPRFRMCSNCESGACSWSAGRYDKSFQQITHGLGKMPSRVLVSTYMTTSRNNGYRWEAISGAGGDDEQHQRTGLVYGYDNDEVTLWAPTRSNGRVDGRIAGVIDGWGNNVNNQVEQCVMVDVKVWS
jgi:hypothetical protein